MKKYLIIILIGYAVNGFGQTSYSLADCIEYTLKNHPTLKVYDNNVAMADERGKQNRAGYLPQISGTATTLDNLSLQSTILTSDFTGPDPVSITMGSQYTTNAYLDISQTLFDKSKIAEIQSTRPYKEKSVLERRQNEENIIYNTATSFFQILIFKEQLNILKANKAKYEEMYRVMKFQFEKGALLEKEVKRIKVNLNSVEYQIQDAETKLQLSYNTLKNAMGMPMASSLDVKTSSDYENYLQNPDEDFKPENLTDYKLNENAVAIEQSNLQIQKAGYYPKLSAVGRFGSQSLTNEFSEIYIDWNRFSYIGLSLNVPIFSGFRRKSQVSESKLKLENQIATFNINKDKLRLAYENAQTSLGTAYSNYLNNKDNMKLAKEVLDVTDYQYQRGIANLTDYLNDDTAYKNAQSDYLNSLFNLFISKLNYQKSKGKLTEFIAQINN